MTCPLTNLGLVLYVSISRSLGGSKFVRIGLQLDNLLEHPQSLGSHGTLPRSRGALPLGRPRARKLDHVCHQDEPSVGHRTLNIDTGLSLFENSMVSLKPNPFQQRIQR